MTGPGFENSANLYQACSSPLLELQTQGYQALWDYVYRVAWYVLYDQPGAEDLAQECAQQALLRIHARLADCRAPAAFRGWARQIVVHLAIDELRHRQRLTILPEPEVVWSEPSAETGRVEEAATTHLREAELTQLIRQSPLSDRSKRVIFGRFWDNLPDEMLAVTEGQLAGQTVLPSHVQVTRAKNIAKLRAYPPLIAWVADSWV